MKKIFWIAAFLIYLFPLVALGVRADSLNLSISDNGEGSVSTTEVTLESTTIVTQTNEANLDTSVDVDGNTGGNEASGNSGNTTITTGDITENTEIVNDDLNTNIAENKDGDLNFNGQITDNGSNLTNTLSFSYTTSSSTTQNNTANITNGVTTTANTGNNTADNNSGDVEIITGNIFSEVGLVNQNINFSYDPIGIGGNFDFLISGNGSGSINSIDFSFTNNFVSEVNHLANIINNILQDLTTGGNRASGNLGNVSIITGDITTRIGIANDNINCSLFNVPWELCREVGGPPAEGNDEEEGPKPIIEIIKEANAATSSSGGGGGGSGVGGQVLGLSDTSGETSYYLFWAGLGLIASGLWVAAKEIWA
ncbi:hypothetical protein A2630_01730 [Candidatus Woesebacteria bacterium RIFCSPHIGHO2_01_FULL_44_10]|uniref:Uncharacterized protein n=1 Tax=Candidatus Woesebacteria bacterium RIFCSPLOWO2_01_FULL_44_14 TaxID=1802525 RepID=A0A1F8C146_9BACT|nr:MAG: hypothetical protein A2630_01730 [Candidatus Woesebacteria bacterium RIFCSPHIGHO2_01_FULL_44_10]OGM69992.1 MAG: hypothetical protein A2975_05295 [Candidatus Woesebacteria bacterium RIFCSPLOWO2_01_FULL_44_14]